MTSEKAGAHARCPHCACVKLKERSKMGNRTTASRSAGCGSDNWATDSSLTIFGQTKLATAAATVLLLGLCIGFLAGFPNVYLRMMLLQLWDTFLLVEKKNKEKSVEPIGYRSIVWDATTVLW